MQVSGMSKSSSTHKEKDNRITESLTLFMFFSMTLSFLSFHLILAKPLLETANQKLALCSMLFAKRYSLIYISQRPPKG